MTSLDPYGALRLRDYRLFFVGNFIASCGLQMQTTAIGWDIYLRTGSKLALGYAGLVQFIPVITLFLIAGHVADRFNRKWIVAIASGLAALSSAGLAAISLCQFDYRLMYLCILGVGTARVFQQPAKHSLLPLVVPPEQFTNAVTWNSSSFHMASVTGPAVGGLLIKWTGGPTAVYVLDSAAALCFAVALSVMRLRSAQKTHRSFTARELVAGFRFVRRSQLILGAIALDLFAVLFGGAVMLLPVYAEDILKTGADGLGWMRAAPAGGALVMALVIAHRPPWRHTGRVLLLAVVGFGLATIVFGISRLLWLSLLMLFLTGAFDNVSVVIRHTLVQTLTPDKLRGRVSAVNSLFIGASNELGGFESAIVAHWFGPVVSVVSGGIGTILVVVMTAIRLPKLRQYGRLGSPEPQGD